MIEETERRFEKSMVKDYDLYKSVFPHYVLLESNIGQIIKVHIQKRELDQPNCLELGCGTGITTEQILKHSPGIRITTVVNSREIIRQAKKKLKVYTLDAKLSFIEEDALSALKNLEKESFEIIASAYTLHNFQSNYRSKVLKKIYEVLRPNGLFINLDIIYSDHQEESEAQFKWLIEQLKEFDSLGRRDLQDLWIRHVTEDRNPERILTHASFGGELEEIGFTKLFNPIRYYVDSLYTTAK
jgi:tRNA (cmo5U34)-methyltransferase